LDAPAPQADLFGGLDCGRLGAQISFHHHDDGTIKRHPASVKPALPPDLAAIPNQRQVHYRHHQKIRKSGGLGKIPQVECRVSPGKCRMTST
jgi:hypothetical protein